MSSSRSSDLIGAVGQTRQRLIDGRVSRRRACRCLAEQDERPGPRRRRTSSSPPISGVGRRRRCAPAARRWPGHSRSAQQAPLPRRAAAARLDLAHLEPEEVDALGPLARRRLDRPRSGPQLAASSRTRSRDLRPLARQRRRYRSRISSCSAGPKQRQVVALAVDVDQERAEPRQHPGGRRPAVDPGRAPAGGGDLATEDERCRPPARSRVLEREPADVRATGNIGNVERRLDARRFAPVRTTSAPTRSPSTAPSASMMIDLPAPVSPVRALKPGSKPTRSSSMMAKSRMASSSSRSLQA